MSENSIKMSQREDALKFETGRIKALQEERLHIQKKTFTKWMNSFLTKARMEVEDLFTDLADGKKLLKLLEVISGEKLGKPNNGKMRVHKIENVNKSLAFLHTKVRLESIGAEDIVDGNPRLILGLIWTIILRFQIQEIEIDVDEENESSEKKSAKDALLLWCQRKTKGYNNVNIQDFTGSWRSGLGFNALIHAHRPDLIEFNKLVPTKHIDNLNNAFDVAERGLGIPRLLDAEDIDTAKPDEKSVLTYVASYYHTFAQMYNKDKSGRRIANIISQIKEADDLKSKYELDAKSLLAWINDTTKSLDSRDFPNNLEGVQKLLASFKVHITVHKPPKYNEKSEIEANYFIINTRLKELNQVLYTPPDGLLVHDIEKGWERLEKSEYKRELALREEVIRQTNLEQLAIRFEKKSLLREGYLKDMIQVLSDPRYGVNLSQVEATLKKHEAISADILAREQRCEQLVSMAEYLVSEGYHGGGKVQERAGEISRTWGELIKLLDTHRGNLERFSGIMGVIRDIDALVNSVGELEGEVGSSREVGVHLVGVEDLLGTHMLVESQIASLGESIRRVGKVVGGWGDAEVGDGKEVVGAQLKYKGLVESYERLVKDSKARREKLEDSKAYFQFVQDMEEQEVWVNEKCIVLGGVVGVKDLIGVVSFIAAHKVLLDEMKGRRAEFGKVCERGSELVRVWGKEGLGDHEGEVKDINSRVEALEGKWGELMRLGEGRGGRLQVMLQGFQFYADANETDSWISEKRPLVSSLDYGIDEPSAQALLQRHVNLEEEIIAYESDVKGLNSEGGKLISAGINCISDLVCGGEGKDNVVMSNGGTEESSVIEEFVTEQKLVPEEYFEDEVVERSEYRTVTEERAVPQVKALYLFQGQDIEIKKGEVMFLLSKTNSDWWNVRKANGEDGFVPANYVKEIEPKVVMVQVRKPEVVRESKKVKKTRMVLRDVTKPVVKKPIRKSGSSNLTNGVAASGTPSVVEPIKTRTDRVNKDYSEILKLSSVRKKNLQESIKLFQFLRECDDFEKWISEKVKYLEGSEENVQVAKRGFEKFLTDFSASNKRVVEIKRLVEEFEGGGVDGGVLEKVRGRGKRVEERFEELVRLKGGKERSLEGALSVELFFRSCEEVIDWMNEKSMQIETDEWSGYDLKSVKALQRKHAGLERELEPIRDKVERVKELAESVKKSYPGESENVEKRKLEVVKDWDALVRRAEERKAALENCVGNQIFCEGVKGLVRWGESVVELLDGYVMSRDVSSAENAIKVHSDLGDEIKSKSREFEELRGLGGSLRGVSEELGKLSELERTVGVKYSEKSDWLSQVLDLQVFNREADAIDGGSRNHLQYLKDRNVGGDLDGVESLIKMLVEFENTLVAQDERLGKFVGMGGKLVEAGHFSSGSISERVGGVVKRRDEVKSLAKIRRDELERSLKYHEFNNDVEETISWVNEKIRVAKDESYKDLTNVGKKLKKHEAFAGELRANEVRIKNINRAGEKLVGVVPEKEREVVGSIEKLNGLWGELCDLSIEKLEKLRQAEAQAGFNKNLGDVLDRVGRVQRDVDGERKTIVGDRRACKDAVKKAGGLVSEVKCLDGKVKELERVAADMEKDKHFDGDAIVKRVGEAREAVDSLLGPVEDLKKSLERDYAYWEFLHELEVETGWINEKKSVVSQELVVQDLYQAQSAVKKHKKVEQEVSNRGVVVEKLVEKSKGIDREDVPGRVSEFVGSYEALKRMCEEKGKTLELSLKAQQFFFDAGEVESWLVEKMEMLKSCSGEVGKDIHAAVKLLTKHKTLELEIDSYDGIVSEMRWTGNQMVKEGHPDKNLISSKIQGVEDMVVVVRKLGVERRERLINRVGVLEYVSEAEEFLKFVEEVFGREVGSEDYGVDYEHLLVLKGRFSEVEIRVDVVNERFKVLESVAERFVDSDYDGEVGRVRGVVREKWNNMLSSMAAREQKLHAAGEIHAFSRDVADALGMITEKLNSIPEDVVGRDVHSCETMLRGHEVFENDLLALEAQLQVLVDDASRLVSLYPSNAQNIKHEQSVVIESWGNLQNKATVRKEQLQNAVDFWRFSADYANLMSFVTSLINTIPSQPKVRDTASSQGLMVEHERIRGEIDARKSEFERVVGVGVEMVKESHPESGEVSRMVGVLEEGVRRLEVEWERKKVYLDQLIDLNIFLRDAKGLETSCVGWEVGLGNLEGVGGGDESVEECEGVFKRFEGMEKLIVGGQEEKFQVLKSQGGKLVRQGHFESNLVVSRLEEVAGARSNVLGLVREKRVALERRLKFVQFLRDVGEMVGWVDEKVGVLRASDNSSGGGGGLPEKIKRLKKHQGVSAEVASNSSRVKYLVGVGVELGDVENVRVLEGKWGELVRLVAEFGKDLEEASELLDFSVAVEEMEAWVREKEALVNAGDTGRDYEHCVEIIKRLDDVDSGVRVDDGRVKVLNALADKLRDVEGVEGKRKALNEKWEGLKGGVESYRAALNRALETHAYNRDAEDVNYRIAEKLAGIKSVESVFGKDLEHVEALVRKHDMVEAQVLGIESKVRELESVRVALVGKGVDEGKLVSLSDKWMEVSGAVLERRNGLSSSLEYHKFLKKVLEVKSYLEGVRARVDGSVLGGNVQEAEMSLRVLRGVWDEVRARDGAYEGVIKVGKRFVFESHEYSDSFSERVGELEGLRGGLEGSFKCMEEKLGKCLLMQKLFSGIGELEREIVDYEGILGTCELGESLGGVVVLLRRHTEFMVEFGGVEGKVSDMIAQGNALIPGHYDGDTISARLAELKSKLDRLKTKANDRSTKLHESYELHKFVLEIHEIEAYAVEKLKIAVDDNYSDLCNLQSKIARHEAFVSEVQGNYVRVKGVEERVEGLLGGVGEGDLLRGFVVEIGGRVEGLCSVWKELEVACGVKSERLGESYQAFLFYQSVDDFEAWVDELEGGLESSDHGRDLESVEGLIVKLNHLEREFTHKSEVVAGLVKSAEAFRVSGHYMGDEIIARVDGIRVRYDGLSEPLSIRKENLEETKKYFEFVRDVDEEVGWVGEKSVSSSSGDLGANLTQVQSLQKKHNQLESEIIAHEPIITSLQSRATQMVRSGHYASEQITTHMGECAKKFQELKDSAALRRLRLADSLVSQSFYDEANEVLSWVGEKRSFVERIEFSEFEDVSGLVKRVERFKNDLVGFGGRVDGVKGFGDGLVGRGHFDSEGVKRKVEEVSYEYGELQKFVDRKACKLRDCQRGYEFNKAVSEAIAYIHEIMNIAGSEEYGRDVEDVERLIVKFESFMGNVQEDRALVVSGLGDELVEEGYPDVEMVKGRCDEVLKLYEEFKELAGARMDALAGAKQVHAFDRTADETISWIHEKYSVVCSEEYGHDLESIQSLIRRHGVFENDLKPVESKVGEVRDEASRLRGLFVDASEHVDDRLKQVEEAWGELVERSKVRGDKLREAEDLQAYFDRYEELIGFVNEFVAKVTSGGGLGGSVEEAEKDVAKNEGLMKEIKSFKGVEEFCGRGEELIKSGHFMGDEIRDKISVLTARWEYLVRVGEERGVLYKKNLDLRLFLVEVDGLDKWLSGKEGELKKSELGDSIVEVEELIRGHEEFVHNLEAQERRVEGLMRKTLVEEEFERVKREEEVARELEAKRVERVKLDVAKKRELDRIAGEISRSRGDGDGKDVVKEGGNRFSGFTGRIGSFFEGGGRRRGSEPTTPTTSSSPAGLLLSPPIISLTPPSSLNSLYSSASGGSSHHQNTVNPDPQPTLSRSESLRLLNTTTTTENDQTKKKPKRTPSFTTRRRTTSFRNKKKPPENLPPVEIEGYLERKHELQAGGKRAAVRSWKTYYVILCGQLVCFFKDQDDFENSRVGASSPVNIIGCSCSVAEDYTKRKFVFRVRLGDGSEWLFCAESRGVMEDWVKKINFHAGLEAKDQMVMMMNEPSNQALQPPPSQPPNLMKKYDSSSTDDEVDYTHHHHRKPKPRNSNAGGASNLPRSREPIYANEEPTTTTTPLSSKPPIPPRSSSIIEPTSLNQRNGSSSDVGVDNQQYFVQPGSVQSSRPLSVDRVMYYNNEQNASRGNNGNHNNYHPVNNKQVYNTDSIPYGLYPQQQHQLPPPAPLPRNVSSFKPPPQPQSNVVIVNNRSNSFNYHGQQHQQRYYNQQQLHHHHQKIIIDTGSGSRDRNEFSSGVVVRGGPTSTTPQPPTTPRSTGSLPPGLSLQQQFQQETTTTTNTHNSSSENEQGLHSSTPSPSSRVSDNFLGDEQQQQKASKGSKKKSKGGDGAGATGGSGSSSSGGLMGLFKRKKATNL